MLEGFEDFNRETEVLGCVIFGTGAKGTKRAFPLKLRLVTAEILETNILFDIEHEISQESYVEAIC